MGLGVGVIDRRVCPGVLILIPLVYQMKLAGWRECYLARMTTADGSRRGVARCRVMALPSLYIMGSCEDFCATQMSKGMETFQRKAAKIIREARACLKRGQTDA